MPKHHTIGDESPFMKRVLIPFWVVRDIVMIFEMVLYGLLIGVAVSALDDMDDAQRGTLATVVAPSAVILVIIAVCLALDLVCIIKRSRRTLTPPFFLGTNIAQTVVWTVLFILSVVGVGARTALSILISVVIYLSFVGLLIYASVIYHRHRKGALRGAYVPAVNPGQPGLVYNNNAGIVAYPLASYGDAPHPLTSYGDAPQPAYYELQAQNQPAQPYGYPQPAQPHGYPAPYRAQ